MAFMYISPACLSYFSYVVDIDEKAAKAWAAKAPNCEGVTSLDPVLNDASVKAIVVCTPTGKLDHRVEASQ